MDYYNRFRSLLHDDNFKPAYKEVINGILNDFDSFNTDTNYKLGINELSQKKEIGVLIKYRDEWIWSWMNTINTNYSCFEILVNSINGFAKRDGKKDENYFKFNGEIKDSLKELEMFKEALKYYKNDLFKPNNDKDSTFTAMKLKTQSTWYKGSISQNFLLENIPCFFNGKCQFNLDYRRGIDEDMNKGVDFKIKIDDIVYTSQHKKDTLDEEYSNDEYDYFPKIKLDYKYRKLNFFSVGDYDNNKIYIYKNIDGFKDCGKWTIDKYDKYKKKKTQAVYLRMKKSLRIGQIEGTELKNKLSLSLNDLLEYCCKYNINFHITSESSVIGNTIEYTEEPYPNVHIVYNDIRNESFDEEVKKILDFLKKKPLN